MRRRAYRLWIWRLAMVAGAIVMLLVALLGTERGRLTLARAALERLAHDARRPVIVEDLRWPALNRVGAARVRCLDAAGRCWLELTGANVEADLRALRARHVHIRALTVARVALSGGPGASAGPVAKEARPAWRVSLDRVQFAHVALGAAGGFINDLEAAAQVRIAPGGMTVGWALTGAAAGIPGVVGADVAKLASDGNWRLSDGTHATTGSVAVTGMQLSRARTEGRVRAAHVHADWDLTISPTSPAGHVALALDALAVDRGAQPFLAPVRASVSMELGAQSLLLQGQVDADTALCARATALLPCAWLPRAPWVAPDARRTAQAQLTATGDAAALAQSRLRAGQALAGALALDVRAEGVWSNPALTAHANLADGWFRDRDAQIALDGIGAEVWVTGNRTDISSTGDVRAAVSGVLATATTNAVDGDLALAWQLGSLPAAPVGGMTLTVGTLAVTGSTLTGRIAGSGRIEGAIAPDALQVTGWLNGGMRMTNVAVAAHATVPYVRSPVAPWIRCNTNANIRGTVTARAALEEVARAFLPPWQQAGGSLVAELEAELAAGRPLVAGRVALTEGRFDDVARGLYIRALELEAAAGRDGPITLRASARDLQSGNIAATGFYARVEGQAPESGATLTVSRFTAAHVFGTALPLSGALHWTGTGRVARVSGGLSLPDTRIKLPRRLPPSVTDVRVIDETSTAWEARKGRRTGTWPLDVDVDVALTAREGLRIEGQKLRSEWQGKGRIAGRAPAVRLGGNVSLVRGSVNFLGRFFTVTRGEILLTGSTLTPPMVSISAEARVSGTTIRLGIEGPATAPQLSLGSDPPLERGEIMSRLLFGKDEASISPWQVVYLAHALQVLEGSGSLLHKLDRGRTVLGVDQVSMKQSEDDSSLAGVTLGRRLNERIYVEGEVGFQDEESVLAIESELTPHIILRTETATGMRDGISINWRYDY